MSRFLYRLGMYTGVRALRNRLRARRLPLPAGAEQLNGRTLHVRGLGSMRLAVHARPRPASEPRGRRFAMVSARQLEPAVRAPLYAYLCATTHFGCGHLELALYEERGAWTIHGVRNTARSNAERLGWESTAQSLVTELAPFLCSVVDAVREQGRPVRMAAARECVRLSVQPSLIPRARRARALRTLQAHYERLHAALI